VLLCAGTGMVSEAERAEEKRTSVERGSTVEVQCIFRCTGGWCHRYMEDLCYRGVLDPCKLYVEHNDNDRVVNPTNKGIRFLSC